MKCPTVITETNRSTTTPFQRGRSWNRKKVENGQNLAMFGNAKINMPTP